MSTKPLNLSILVGDRNRAADITPRSTPRHGQYRVPSPTKSNKTNNPSGAPPANLKFRQWPDPPPPPSRSRTIERKFTTAKRRPGSVDSRFRRTITDPAKADGASNENKKSLQDIKTEFILNARDFSTSPSNTKSQAESTDISTKTSELYFPKKETHNAATDTSPKNEIINNLTISTSESTQAKSDEISITKPNKQTDETENIDTENDLESVSEMFDNHKTARNNKLKSTPINVGDIILKELEISSSVESRIAVTDRFSQTDICIGIRPGNSDVGGWQYKEDESIFLERLSDKSSTNSRADSLVLNRTRSVGNIISQQDSLETILGENEIYKESASSFTENRYFRYVEIWVVILMLVILSYFSWCFIFPAVEECVCDFYFTWISPKPKESSNFIFDFINELFSTIGDIFFASSHSRLKNF